MRAIETTATINKLGQLTLDEPLTLAHDSRVRVIVLIAEDLDPEDLDPKDLDSEENSIETIREGLYEGWQEALSGKPRPVSQLWVGMDVD